MFGRVGFLPPCERIIARPMEMMNPGLNVRSDCIYLGTSIALMKAKTPFRGSFLFNQGQ